MFAAITPIIRSSSGSTTPRRLSLPTISPRMSADAEVFRPPSFRGTSSSPRGIESMRGDLGTSSPTSAWGLRYPQATGKMETLIRASMYNADDGLALQQLTQELLER